LRELHRSRRPARARPLRAQRRRLRPHARGCPPTRLGALRDRADLHRRGLRERASATPPAGEGSTGTLRDLEFVRDASEVAHFRGRLIHELTAHAKPVEAHVPGRTLQGDALYWHPELGIWAAFSEWEG